MVYNVYPAVDDVTKLFPPSVMTALGKSAELKNTVIPMTQADRNNLAGAELWTGRLIFNTTTNKINRYNAGWFEIDKDVRTDPLTLPGAPTLDLHAATKNYVDTYRAYPGRNRIINGDFSVNQRLFTTTNVTATYGHDRWKLYGSGSSFVYSNQAAALGTLPESAQQFARIATSGQAATSDHAVLAQSIESVRTFSGKTVTLSFWAKANVSNVKIGIEFRQMFGSGGSPSAQVAGIGLGTNITVSTVWTRYSATIQIPSISGKTLGTIGDDQLLLLLWTSAGSVHAASSNIGLQNLSMDFWGVQLEEGALLTPYEQKTYLDELRNSQRYFVKAFGNSDLYYNGWSSMGFAHGVSGTSVRMMVVVPTPLRGKPTLTVSNLTIYSGDTVLASSGVASTYWSPQNPTGMFADINVVSGGVAGKAYTVYTDRGTTGWYAIDCEY